MYRSYDVGLLHLFSSVRRRNRATYDSQRAALYSPNYTARRTPEIEDVILFSGDGVSPLLSVSSKTGFIAAPDLHGRACDFSGGARKDVKWFASSCKRRPIGAIGARLIRVLLVSLIEK